MMMKTTTAQELSSELVSNYFKTLVNNFFKILPMRENNEGSIDNYLRSFQMELIGCKNIIESIHNDPSYLTLISIVQYFIDNPECSVKEVRRETFRAISICNKLKERYGEQK